MTPRTPLRVHLTSTVFGQTQPLSFTRFCLLTIMVVSLGQRPVDAFAVRGWSLRHLGLRRVGSSTPPRRCSELTLPNLPLPRCRSLTSRPERYWLIGGFFSDKPMLPFRVEQIMVTRFVPTHIRSAIAVVKTDHERTTTERDAFASFLHRISNLSTSQSSPADCF